MTELAIKLESVTKRYRYFTLDNIDLEVPAGEIMGLIGPNGAGKSTTIRILLGLVHQDSGNVRVLGHSMPAEQIEAKWNIGFASQDIRLKCAAENQRPLARPASQGNAAVGAGPLSPLARPGRTDNGSRSCRSPRNSSRANRRHERRRSQHSLLFAQHAGRRTNFRSHYLHRPRPDYRFDG